MVLIEERMKERSKNNYSPFLYGEGARELC
jgi:hypothetical protein